MKEVHEMSVYFFVNATVRFEPTPCTSYRLQDLVSTAESVDFCRACAASKKNKVNSKKGRQWAEW